MKLHFIVQTIMRNTIYQKKGRYMSVYLTLHSPLHSYAHNVVDLMEHKSQSQFVQTGNIVQIVLCDQGERCSFWHSLIVRNQMRAKLLYSKFFNAKLTQIFNMVYFIPISVLVAIVICLIFCLMLSGAVLMIQQKGRAWHKSACYTVHYMLHNSILECTSHRIIQQFIS